MKYGATRIAASQRKLQELILYISMKSEGDERFGKVKLNKLLFFSDLHAYLHLGSTITGQEYQALPKGPAPRAMLPIMQTMEELGEIAIREKEYYAQKQHRIFALRPPVASILTPKEKAIVDGIIQKYWGKNATEISDESHDSDCWRLMKQGETIPFCIALVGNRKPTPAERRIGKTLEPVAREWLARN